MVGLEVTQGVGPDTGAGGEEHRGPADLRDGGRRE
ncbi:predicted protein [Streptomyces viridosporus ATCC 14672]|uniref:Predicted protein n=1 Tax=Streptomyces viridosporus (strain ATCC 14672 / DSM 40746 / JCM 4963 / KCTC 9882 / NRRL B-12104 / FH 1290) TaxID=566461 RepID=D6A5J8_STRV1|nr:predicted protein [Streptomyces viridosporus ATCC 14672]